MTDLEQAVSEAITYNRMGALDQNVLNDIAYYFNVDPKDILEELGWSRDYYD